MAFRSSMSRMSGGGSSGRGRSLPGINWVGLEAMANNINRRGKTLNRTRKEAMGRLAAEMQSYAQENAPWEDRTGDARDRLQAYVVHDDNAETSTIWLAHGVDYGSALETMRGGELAIIMPTILQFQDRVVGAVVDADRSTEV